MLQAYRLLLKYLTSTQVEKWKLFGVPNVIQYKWPMIGQYTVNYQWQASIQFNWSTNDRPVWCHFYKNHKMLYRNVYLNFKRFLSAWCKEKSPWALRRVVFIYPLKTTLKKHIRSKDSNVALSPPPPQDFSYGLEIRGKKKQKYLTIQIHFFL